MDELYYPRISLPGWVFITFTLTTLWVEGGLSWPIASLRAHSTGTTLGDIAVGAFIGVGLPPTCGFLLGAVVSVFFSWKRWAFRNYPAADRFERNLRAHPNYARLSIPSQGSSALFQVYFLSYADQELVHWSRRRRTLLHATFSSAFAIWLSLILTSCLRVFTWWTLVPGVLISIALVRTGQRQLDIHMQTMQAWVDTIAQDKILSSP